MNKDATTRLINFLWKGAKNTIKNINKFRGYVKLSKNDKAAKMFSARNSSYCSDTNRSNISSNSSLDYSRNSGINGGG